MAIRMDAEAIAWTDKDVLHSLQFWFRDYADETTSVCTASPNEPVASQDAEQCFSCVHKDI